MRIVTLLKRQRVLLAAVALCAAGCIISGQFVIEFLINKTIQSTHATMDYVLVDLTDDETWEDHADDIQSVVDIKFEVRFVNNLAAPTTGEVWVSDADNLYPTVAGVQEHATKILSGIVLGSSETKDVSFKESAQYISNLQTLLDLAESGKFYAYGIAGTTEFDITITGVPDQSSARLLVTISAG